MTEHCRYGLVQSVAAGGETLGLPDPSGAATVLVMLGCTVQRCAAVSASAVIVAVAAAMPARAVSVAHAAGPPCTRHEARVATSRSPLGATMRGEVGDPSADPLNFQFWIIASGTTRGFYCVDLGNGRTDMVVEFMCCTVHSPTPLAIFRPVGGRWRLSYSWNGEPPIYGLRLHRHTLVERRPVWRPSDSLCCPSGGNHYYAIRWVGNGLGFSVTRTSHF